MSVAAVVGLLLPALDEGEPGAVAAGLIVGLVFLLASRSLLEGHHVHVGRLHGAGVRRAVLVFGVLLVHSLPEGFAIGAAFASDTEGLALFVILAIALENVPEGTSVAIPMESAGFGRACSSGRRFSRARPAGGSDRRIPGGRGNRGSVAVLVRLRRRGHAGARPVRGRASGLRSARADGRPGGIPAGAGLMLALAAGLGVEG
jgi:hypothetical protein